MYVTMLVVSVLVFAIMTFIYLRHPSASIFNPATVYLAFHGVLFVIRPIVGYVLDYSKMYHAMRFTPSVWDKTQVLIATNLAFVVFMMVMIYFGEKLVFKQTSEDFKERDRLLAIFIPIAIVLSIISLNSLFWLWDYQASGRFITNFDTRTGDTSLNEANGYFISLTSMLASICALLAYLARFKLWSLAPLLAFGLLRFGTGKRGDVVAAVMMIALLYFYDKRKRWPSMVMILAVFAFLPVFDSIQRDRGSAIRESFGVGETQVLMTTEDEKFLETMDLANMEFFEYIVYVVPQRSGTYDYFLNNLQILTEPIPRALWSDKPVGAPIKNFELYKWGRVVGATMSIPGAGWYSWGYIGVIIWAAVFAAIYGSVYRRFVRSGQSNLAVMAFMIFVATSIVSYRDGTIVTILKQSLFYFIPLVALVIAARIMGLQSPSSSRNTQGERLSALGRNGLAAITPRARRLATMQLEAEQIAEDARSMPVAQLGGAGADTPKGRRLARMAGG